MLLKHLFVEDSALTPCGTSHGKRGPAVRLGSAFTPRSPQSCCLLTVLSLAALKLALGLTLAGALFAAPAAMAQDDTTAPTFQSATVNGTALVITFNEPLAAAASLANTSFTVKKTPAGGTEEPVSLSGSPSISGATVTLTLSSAVSDTDTGVKVSYTQPVTGTDNRLKDGTGNEVATFTDQVVQVQDTTAPQVARAETNAWYVCLWFNEPMNTKFGQSPSRDAFEILVNGVQRGTFSTSWFHVPTDFFCVRLASEPVAFGDTVTMNYTQPAPDANALMDTSGNRLASFTGQVVDDRTPYPVTSVELSSYAGTDQTYARSEAIEVTVTWPTDVTWDVSPSGADIRVRLDVGGVTRTASLVTGGSTSGTARALVFRYTVTAWDSDADGVFPKPTGTGDIVTLVADATLTTADGRGASQNHAGLSADANHKVNGSLDPDTTAPTFQSATVNGTALVVTFNEPLAAAASLANTSFTVKKTPAGGTEEPVSLSGSPSISGATVTLTLSSAVSDTDTGVKVSYTQPVTGTDNRLKDGTGNEVATFTDQVVQVQDTTAPQVARAETNAWYVCLWFNEPMNTKFGQSPSRDAFEILVNGVQRGTFSTSWFHVPTDFFCVRLASEPVAFGDTVTMNYTQPAPDANALMDTSGNRLASFTGQVVDDRTPYPVTSVELSSYAGTDQTYARSEAIEVTVTWPTDVTWDVSPSGADIRVRLDVGGVTRTASLVTGGSTSGTARALVFRYTVTAWDSDADGVFPKPTGTGDIVTLVADATLTTADGRGASQNHAGLSADANHKVNGSLDPSPSPAATGATVNGKALVIAFDKDLVTTQAPAANRFRYTRGGSEAVHNPQSVAMAARTVTLTLRHTVFPGEAITVQYIAPASGGLQDAEGRRTADFRFDTVTNETPDTTPPAPVRAETSEDGDKVGVSFSEFVAGTPSAADFTVKVDGAERPLTVQGVSGEFLALDLSSAVAHGQSVTVSYSGTVLADDVSNRVQPFTDLPVENRVPASAGPASITSVAITSTPSADSDTDGTPDTYHRSEKIQVTVTWDKDVTWDVSTSGADIRVRLDVGGETKEAALVKGGASTGTAGSLKFRYRVREADRDTDGVSPKPNGLGDIVLLVGAATLTAANGASAGVAPPAASGLSADSNHKVDGTQADTTAPTLSGTEVVGDRLTLTYSERLDETSVPTANRFGVTVEGEVRAVDSISVDGTTVTLILASAVTPGQTVRLAYSASDADRIQDLAANPAPQIDQGVSNQTVDNRAPQIVSATVDGYVLTFTFDEKLDGTSPPNGGRAGLTHPDGQFYVRGTVSGDFVISGSTARTRLALHGAVASNNYIAWYNPNLSGSSLGANKFRDTSGNEVAAFSVPVINETPFADVTPASATLSGKTLTVTFSGPVTKLSTYQQIRTPRTLAYAFAITGTVDGGDQHPGTVAVSESTVTLELQSVLSGDRTVALSYIPEDADEKLVDAGGAVLAHFADWPVDYATGGRPVLERGEIVARGSGDALTTLRLTFDEVLDGASLPAGNAFHVTVSDTRNEYPTEIQGRGTASVLGADVEVEVPFGVDQESSVSVSYDRPERSPLRDVDGNAVAAFEQRHVEVIDRQPPTYVSGSIGGRSAELYFDEALDGSESLHITARADFSVTVSEQPRSISQVTIAGSAVTLTLASSVAAADAVVVPYTPGQHPLRDLAGNEAAGFSDEPLTNAGATDPGKPSPSSAPGVANGLEVAFGFDQPLDASSVPAPEAFALREAPDANGLAGSTGPSVYRVLVQDSVVVLNLNGQVYPCDDGFQVHYTKPDVNPLRNLFGTEADGFATDALTNERAGDCEDWVSRGGGYHGSGSVSGDGDLVLGTGRTLQGNTGLTGRSFRVTATPQHGSPRTIEGTGQARIEGDTVRVRLAARVAPGETLTASYARPPGEAGLMDAAGSQLADFTDVPLENDLDGVEPLPQAARFVSAAVAANGTGVVLTFSKDIEVGGAHTAYAVTVDGAVQATRGSFWENDTVGLVLSQPVRAGETVEVSYAKPGSGFVAALVDADGLAVASFGPEPVANTVPEAPGKDQPPPNAPATGAPTIAGTAQVSETLTASTAGIADPNGLTGAAFAYQWLAGDTDIAGATGASYTLADAQTGRTVKVRVTFTDDAGHAETLTSAATQPVALRPNRPATGAPAIAGTAQAGETLTASTDGIADPDGLTGAAFAYQWLSNDADIASATAASYTLADADVGKRIKVRVAFTDDAGHAETLTSAATAAVAPRPLTASFVGVPAEHDGRTAFSFELRFSDNFPGRLSYKVLKDQALQVTNGRAIGVKRAAPHQNQRWAITVRPWSVDDVTVTLAAGSVQTESGRTLSNTTTVRVQGPPRLSVADAEAREGEDAAVEFAVTLSRAASGTVTVDFATADGTATAGEDYTATSGTLTFAVGETRKTVAVAILDDTHDEGQETFTLRLSNASGAAIRDGEATGTIQNDDPMPKAWTARFGRSVAVHVVDAVEARLEGASQSYVQLGGHRLGGGPDVQETVQRLTPQRDLWAEAEAAVMPGQDPGSSPGQAMTPRRLLLGSAFHLVSKPDDEAIGPRLSAWGRVATSGFDGREDKVSLDGTVTTATLGVDGVWKRWLTGLVLAYSEGDGAFTHADMPGGDLTSSLTSVHPYVAYALSDRVRLWGLVGYGSGALRLDLDDRDAMDTDLTMSMGAVGIRGTLLQPAQPGGLELALRSDVLWMGMDSAAADNLAATQADASRLRLVLEGSRPVALAGGGSFTPSLEIGLRHDGGDAETGTGLEVGGRLRYASSWGLSIEASLRGLLAHEAQDYREWGASAALRFDPGRQGRGFTASVMPAWGTAASGVERLWGRPGTPGLAPADPLATAVAGRLDAELGYGLAALNGRGLLTPYARVALTEGADQAWHLGTRLALAESLNLSLEASRRAREGDVAAHELALRANLGF